ncbi:MAG: hypothetical protein AVDCRST_MAG49-1417 [uncultured Thermomicrobiales bacterium]|uniref:Mur ligase central domain-containing protein n=1 Tax=uncultured Thermomicrobiales bacterium TaxID=1645740 RepID=A0A6J4UGF6_9BACT|nr:MAG: hypothetical protein AVDCRST_MAG49-1417 [uncultured Thermomicrobiales bacterium]
MSLHLATRPTRAVVTALPDDFAGWRRAILAGGGLPMVAVAGSRGKSTVVRLLDSIFRQAGLRTATWTDVGVEVRGQRRRGELGPWSDALAQLSIGSLDVAIQELDWSTVAAVGLPAGVYPLVAVTTICANNEVCLVQDETRRALRAYPTVLAAVAPGGTVVLNGDDYAVAGSDVSHDAPAILVAHNRDTPLLRAHLGEGGIAAWAEDDELCVGSELAATDLGPTAGLRFALGGGAGFEVHNALTAAAAAAACGLTPKTIAAALAGFEVPVASLPGSFNVLPLAEATAVIDRPAPSWYLRPVLRAVGSRSDGRLITVVGRLGGVPDDDLPEVGRLLGRASGALVLHSEDLDTQRAALFRQGVVRNTVPPPVVHVPTERRAVNRGLKLTRPNDTLLVFADAPRATLRAIGVASARQLAARQA